MQNFFEHFEIPYATEFDIHYTNAKTAFEQNGDSILDFEKLNIYTYLKEDLAKIRDEIRKDDKNILYCYFLNSVLKTNDIKLITAVCKPKASEKNEIFDTLPLFSLLYEVPGMCKRLAEKGVPQDVIDATCNMFENQVQDYIYLYGHFGISAYVIWMNMFTNNQIIRVGRFNIEIAKFGNYFVYQTKSGLLLCENEIEGTPIAKPGDPIISVHIPSGGKLDFDENTVDLKRAAKIVTDCFGEFKLFYCNSWLLDPKIKEVLGKETNITRFADRFTRFPVASSGTSVFHYLYLTADTENIDALPENTSMQKAIKKHLQSGGKILNFLGIFTKEDLKLEV